MNLYHVFDTQTFEWHFDKLSSEVSEIIGDTDFTNTAFYAIHVSLYKERYFFIDAVKYPDASRIERSAPIPVRILERAMSNFKESYRKQMAASFMKSKTAQGLGYGKILRLTSGGKITAEFESYKDAAEKLKIPIGTVKTKIRRAARLEPNGKWAKRNDYILCNEYELSNILKIISQTNI
jgi:hypothetical protein